MSEIVKEKKINPTKVRILLKEYELCHKNRDHYDRIGWQIGSIFIALSLAALWAATEKPQYIPPLMFFSIASIVSWVLYSLRVRVFILTSLDRCEKIEKEFGKWELELGCQLHSWIRKRDRKILTGLRCMIWCICVIILAWIFLLCFH